MDQELEERLARFLLEREAEAKVGVSMTSLYAAVRHNTDALSEHIKLDDQRFAKVNGRVDIHRDWWHVLKRNTKTTMREKMPSLSADDSGSIDLNLFGQQAKFTGKWPVRVALILVVVSSLMTAGAVTHSLITKASAQTNIR